MRRKLGAGRRGVLELPSQLVITIIIMAVTASVGFGALSSYSRDAVDKRLRQQAEAVTAAAERLDSMGTGSTLKLEIGLENAPLEKVQYFKVGHPLGRPLHPYSAMVRFKAASAPEGHVYARDAGGNPLPLCSPSGGALELGAGSHRLLLTRLYSDTLGTAFIRCEVQR